MALWRILDYRTSDGENLIAEWYKKQDRGVQAGFDGALMILRAVEDWLNPPLDEFKVLEERHLGLCEVRFDIQVFNRTLKKVFKRKFRPVGIWWPKDHEFMFILGCEKSGRMYDPPCAFDLALKYKARFENGEGEACEHAW